MNVLFLSRFFWPHVGGVEKHGLEVAKRLARRGHKVVIITEELPYKKLKTQSSNLKTTTENSKLENIKIYRTPTGKDDWFKKLRIWAWLWKNKKLIEEADIVHAHDVGFWYWPFRFLYPKKPFYLTFHGWEGKFPVPLKNKLVRKISEKLARGNICVGDYIKKWYGTRPGYTTYGGVESSKFKVQSSKIKNENQIVFVGRLENDTGLPIYLRAIELLHKKYSILNTPYPILFLGEGSLKSEAEKYGKVLGVVKDIRPYLLESRFVFTSGYLSILEAMACRKLVFAVYDNPLKEDYLRLSPFAKGIVIESSPELLYHRLVHDTRPAKEQERLADEVYNWTRGQTWEKVTELYLKLWQ
ncbi:glycosyltransferase family 4 protein [Candidatus Shapirobacteria bacterium]|nr:glycosyltransferase family 4 protein [Candidatus Shapirobacteria bacterium]